MGFSKNELIKFIKQLDENFKWFFDASTKININENTIDFLVRTKYQIYVPSKSDKTHKYYFVREAFDNSDNFMIGRDFSDKDYNEESGYHIWFTFKINE